MLAKLNLGVLTEITQKHNPSITTQGFVVQYVDDNLQPQPSTTVPDFTGYATSSSQDSPQVVQILGTVNIPPDASYSVVLDHNTNYLNNISISHKRFPEDQIDGNCSKKLKE